ncbi:hypothetical protein PMAYCL1PPCAC_26021, partial [Pristionchus mayeri]
PIHFSQMHYIFLFISSLVIPLFLPSLISSLFVQAHLSAIHEKPITLKVKNGGPLSIKIHTPTTIWHREFKDGRPKQFVEACDHFIDVCERWRSGLLGNYIHDQWISVARDGTLNMPVVSPADSAQYYTYYLARTAFTTTPTSMSSSN